MHHHQEEVFAFRINLVPITGNKIFAIDDNTIFFKSFRSLVVLGTSKLESPIVLYKIFTQISAFYNSFQAIYIVLIPHKQHDLLRVLNNEKILHARQKSSSCILRITR